jgi:hypothetical protein
LARENEAPKVAERAEGGGDRERMQKEEGVKGGRALPGWEERMREEDDEKGVRALHLPPSNAGGQHLQRRRRQPRQPGTVPVRALSRFPPL